jgi:hypothetical protein
LLFLHFALRILSGDGLLKPILQRLVSQRAGSMPHEKNDSRVDFQGDLNFAKPTTGTL